MTGRTVRAGAVVGVGEQLALDVGDGLQGVQRALTGDAGEAGKVRVYWENRGPGRWEEVRVRVRYGNVTGDSVAKALFPEVRTVKLGPRNVLVERGDGTMDVKGVRQLRVRRPG